MSADLAHARWVLQHVSRDESRALGLNPGADQVLLAYLEACAPEEQAEALDQILRLAHGVFTEGGEVELARQLVAVLIRTPQGRAMLGESAAGAAWARFAERPGAQLAAPNEPPPKGAIKVGGLGLKIRA